MFQAAPFCSFVSGIMRTMVAAQATYLAFWNYAGAKAIEEKTSGGP